MSASPEKPCETRPSVPLAKRAHTIVQKLFFLIPIGITGNIIFTLSTTDSRLLSLLVRFSPAYFGAALGLAVVPWFTGSLRLFLWSRFLNRTISYGDIFIMVIKAELGAAVAPPAIGVTAVKTGMLMQQGMPGGTALSLTVLENVEDTLFFVLMVPLALTLSSSWDLPIIRELLALAGNPLTWLIAAALGAGIIIFFLVEKKRATAGMPDHSDSSPATRVKEKIRYAAHDFRMVYGLIIRGGKSRFGVTMALTAVQWICRYSIVSLLLMGLGIQAQPLLYMALQVFVFSVMTFVPTPGAAGGAEAAFYFMYRRFLSPDVIGLVTAGWRFLTFYFLVLTASVLVMIFGVRSRMLLSSRARPSS